MGLIDFINKFKNIKTNMQYAKILNGYTPIFSQFGQDIYASDVVKSHIVFSNRTNQSKSISHSERRK